MDIPHIPPTSLSSRFIQISQFFFNFSSRSDIAFNNVVKNRHKFRNKT